MTKKMNEKSWNNNLLGKKGGFYYVLYALFIPLLAVSVIFVYAFFDKSYSLNVKIVLFLACCYCFYILYLALECILFSRRFIQNIYYENGILHSKTFSGVQFLIDDNTKIEVLTIKFRSEPVRRWLANSTNWLIISAQEQYYLSGKMEDIDILLSIIERPKTQEAKSFHNGG
ncbi:MAG: hypothetical protein WAO12_10480 [Venatoribacter sp.]